MWMLGQARSLVRARAVLKGSRFTPLELPATVENWLAGRKVSGWLFNVRRQRKHERYAEAHEIFQLGTAAWRSPLYRYSTERIRSFRLTRKQPLGTREQYFASELF